MSAEILNVLRYLAFFSDEISSSVLSQYEKSSLVSSVRSLYNNFVFKFSEVLVSKEDKEHFKTNLYSTIEKLSYKSLKELENKDIISSLSLLDSFSEESLKYLNMYASAITGGNSRIPKLLEMDKNARELYLEERMIRVVILYRTLFKVLPSFKFCQNIKLLDDGFNTIFRKHNLDKVPHNFDNGSKAVVYINNIRRCQSTEDYDLLLGIVNQINPE